MHEICEGEKRNDDIDVDGVASVEEAEMRSSTDSVNINKDLVVGFYASTCSDVNVYDLF